NEQLLAAFLGAVDVGLAFWMLGLLRVGTAVRSGVTIFFRLGAVFWFTSEKGTTWYFAHIVAVGFLIGAIGLALGRDPVAVDDALEDTGIAEDDADDADEEREAAGSSDGIQRGPWHALRTS